MAKLTYFSAVQNIGAHIFLGWMLLCEVSAVAQPHPVAPPVNYRQPVVSWLVEKDSRLVINGKSNFGGIACHNEQFQKADTISLYRTAVGDSIVCRGRFYLQVVDFSCHNFFYTYNLRKTLKMDQHPQMTVRLVQLDRLPPLQAGAYGRANSLVEICLAGVCRTFEVPVEFIQNADGHCWLKGARMFRLQDFHLESPVKFAGLIRVKNEFVVQFQLSMTRI